MVYHCGIDRGSTPPPLLAFIVGQAASRIGFRGEKRFSPMYSTRSHYSRLFALLSRFDGGQKLGKKQRTGSTSTGSLDLMA